MTACSARGRSKSLDQAGIDQQPVEASRLGAVRAQVEQALAAAEDLFLLRKARVERDPCPFQYDQRQIGRVEGVERGGLVGWPVVHSVKGVVGGEIAGIPIED